MNTALYGIFSLFDDGKIAVFCIRTSGIGRFRSERYRTEDSGQRCLPACIPEMQRSRRL